MTDQHGTEYPTDQQGAVRAAGSRSDRHRRRKSRRKLSLPRGTASYLGHRFAPPAVIAAALAVVMGLGYLTRPEPARAEQDDGTERAAVESNLLACPEPQGSASTSTRLAVATGPASSGPGRAVIDPVGSSASDEPVAVVRKPATAWYKKVSGKSAALAVRANGSMAAGLAAEQTSRSSGDTPGLAGIRCAPPARSFWFVGLGPSAQENGRLYLSNVDTTTATVDVDVFTPQGMVDPAGGRAITVKPHRRETLRIGKLAPNARLAVVHVRTTIGRVSAAVHTRTELPAGVEWVPRAQEPSTELVVPGLPKGDDERQLMIVAPGDRDATVSLHAITKGGTYVPEGRETVQVPAGTVLSLDLAAGLSGRAAAIRLSSNVPITAGAFAAMQVGAGASDIAFTAATPALDGMAVVADNRAADGHATRLLLTAPEGGAEVIVSTITPDGKRRRPGAVRIKAGHTASVKVPAPPDAKKGFAVVVEPRPDSGPVYGARLLRQKVAEGTMLTVLPLVTARNWVTVPAVGGSLSAVITPHR